jgi:hypothetical protein
MTEGLDRLLKWILGNLNEVIWLVVLFGGLLLPIFRRLAQARNREGGGERPIPPPPPKSARSRPGGPASFDWERWFEEKMRGEIAQEEEEIEAPAPRPVPPKAGGPPSPPLWERPPLTREAPLTELRPFDELVEPLTQRRAQAPAPLTSLPGEGGVPPLTEMPAYDAEVVPEGVGTLEAGGVVPLGEGYRPALESPTPEVLDAGPVSSLAAEVPFRPPAPAAVRAIAGLSVGPGTDWRAALVLGEILGRPAALRPGESAGLGPTGL